MAHSSRSLMKRPNSTMILAKDGDDESAVFFSSGVIGRNLIPLSYFSKNMASPHLKHSDTSPSLGACCCFSFMAVAMSNLFPHDGQVTSITYSFIALIPKKFCDCLRHSFLFF